jgi:hypothetical protein
MQKLAEGAAMAVFVNWKTTTIGLSAAIYIGMTCYVNHRVPTESEIAAVMLALGLIPAKDA